MTNSDRTIKVGAVSWASRTVIHDFETLFFRDRRPRPSQHIVCAKRWGEINVNRPFESADWFMSS